MSTRACRTRQCSSCSALIAKPLAAGGPNPLCTSAENKPVEGPENQFMVGALANFEESAECKGNWIRASVTPDGAFRVTNGRNGFTKTYAAR